MNVKSVFNRDKSTKTSFTVQSNKRFQQVLPHAEALLKWLNHWTLSHAHQNNHSCEWCGNCLRVGVISFSSSQIISAGTIQGWGEFKEIRKYLELHGNTTPDPYTMEVLRPGGTIKGGSTYFITGSTIVWLLGKNPVYDSSTKDRKHQNRDGSYLLADMLDQTF